MCFTKEDGEKMNNKKNKWVTILFLISLCFVWFGQANKVYAKDISIPKLKEEQIFLAVGGDKGQIKAVNGKIKDCTSLDTGIITVTKKGTITGKKAGTAAILVSVLGTDNEYYALYCEVIVMNPKLSEEIVILKGSGDLDALLTIDGLIGSIEDKNIICKSSESDIASVEKKADGIYIYGNKTGKAEITVEVYGKKLTCNVSVASYGLENQVFTLAKGKSKTIKVSNSSNTITWKSSDKKIATVNSKGKITAKGIGNAVITGKAGEETYTCYVSVAANEAIKAVEKAYISIGAMYSQAKRMEEGYFDCSSLTWRCYSPYDVFIGNETWAPTAADQAKWCVENDKIIAEKAVEIEELTLVPGDLVFYAKEESNGRFKNIYHVALFAGYEIVESADGEVRLKGNIVDANGRAVAESEYRTTFSFDKGIVYIARLCNN